MVKDHTFALLILGPFSELTELTELSELTMSQLLGLI